MTDAERAALRRLAAAYTAAVRLYGPRSAVAGAYAWELGAALLPALWVDLESGAGRQSGPTSDVEPADGLPGPGEAILCAGPEIET